MCLAIPMKVTRLDGDRALVELDGVQREIGLALLENVQLGEYLIVHAGFAIERLDPEAALETLELFRQIGSITG